MKIAIAADHAGFALKERVRRKLVDEGHEVIDFGTGSEEACDYPDFAQAAARDVAAGRSDRGILVCGTGTGMAIAANKVHGVRAAQVQTEELARLAREHNDANVLALGARYLEAGLAERMVETFLSAEFQGGRHARRVAKIARLDNQ